MTGGGGDGYYVPPVRKRVTVSCEMLEVLTVLTHPNEELLATLEVGQIQNARGTGQWHERVHGSRFMVHGEWLRVHVDFRLTSI